MTILYRRLAFLFLLVAGISWLSSCQSGDLDVGSAITPNVQLGVQVIDTMTVNMSTVITDSVATSGTNTLLVGRTADSRFGIIRTKAYFRVQASSFVLSGANTRYDSLVLYLRYSGSYGDTSKVQRITVHQQTRDVDPNITHYSPDSLPYNSTPLGSISFRPQPTQQNTLAIKLSNSIGQTLYQGLKDIQITSNTNIQDLIRGLVLAPGSSDNGALLSFTAAAANSYIRMYYHDNDLSQTAYTYDLSIESGNTQFNQILNDRSKTPYASINSPLQSLSSRLTNEETLFLLGVGLRTKIEIPYLFELRNIPGFGSINRVELDLNPIRSTVLDNTRPPQTLVLQQVNTRNEYIGIVPTLQGTDETAPYLIDSGSPIFANLYRFSLTNYVNQILRNQAVNRGMLINATDNGASINRVVFGSQQHPTNPLVLRVYYTASN